MHTRLPLPSDSRRFFNQRGLTLIEVLIASAVMVIVFSGVVGALIQCRRLSENSIKQASSVAIVQGYIEQIKNMEYTNVFNSPDISSTDIIQLPTIRDQLTADPLTLSRGEAPTSLPAIGTSAAGAIDNIDDIDINNTPSDTNDDLRLNIWVWVKDLSVASSDIQDAKSITLIYTYEVKDGAKVRAYRDGIRTIRSIVPSF